MDTEFSSSLWRKHCSHAPSFSGRPRDKIKIGVFWSTKKCNTVLFSNCMRIHAPGVPACWPMRGSPPSAFSWTGVISCSAVITMVFSSTSSQVGLEKADRGRVILCISRSYTRCSCCFFRSRPLSTNAQQSLHCCTPLTLYRLIKVSNITGREIKTHSLFKRV